LLKELLPYYFSAIKLTRISRVGQDCGSEGLAHHSTVSISFAPLWICRYCRHYFRAARDEWSRHSSVNPDSFEFTKSKAREILEPLESLEEGIVKA